MPLFIDHVSVFEERFFEERLPGIPKRFGIFVDNVFCERKMPVRPKYFGGFIPFADWLPVDLGKEHTIEPQEE